MIVRQLHSARIIRGCASCTATKRPIMPLKAKITISNAMAQGSRSQSTGIEAAKIKPENDPDDVLFDSIYGVRTILLNRPRKHNALTGSMAGKILPRLLEWQKSEMANMIIIKGAGGKAFCAGGDVAVLASQNKTGEEGQQASLDYFALEYKLDNLIAKLKKPYIAFMDGITMGGGAGLSIHGHFRIATEKTQFAMPETTIGFFPDVGASFFLPRLDGYLGTYLALTSEKLVGVQAYWAGVATHYTHSSSLPDLQERLAELKFSDYDNLATRLRLINSTMDEFMTGLPYNEPFILGGPIREAIDRCFKYNTIEEIITALQEENSEWARETIRTLHQRSPTSVRVALLQMRYGSSWSIDSTFYREHQLAAKFMDNDRHPDFVEGVEKQLAKPVKSDDPNVPPVKKTPVWNPPSLEETSTEQAVQYFEVEQGSKRLDLVRDQGEDYMHYPHGWLGLPSENAIKLILQQGDITSEKLLEKIGNQWDGKAGVREKVLDVFRRKVVMDDRGFAAWNE